MSRIFVGILAALAAASGCSDSSEPYSPPPPPGVTVLQPVTREVVDYADYTGNASALETVDLRARVEGYLTKVNYRAGSVVKQGDLLFVIDPKPYELAVQQAQAELDARKAQVVLQESMLRQYQEAKTGGAATEFEILQATGKTEAAKASVLAGDAALEKSRLDLSYTQVKAPFDGLINRTQVDVGNLVGAGEPTVLATIVRFDPIYAYFSVSENDLLQYIRAARARDRGGDARNSRIYGEPVLLGLADEEGYPHQGKVDSAENRIDPATGTLTIRGIFPNADRSIVSGSFVRIRLPLGRLQAILVPDVAIGTDQGGQYVLTVDDQNTVQQQRVTTGKLFGTLRQITTGLRGNEWVIVKGVQRARPGRPVTPVRQTLPAETAAATTATAPLPAPSTPGPTATHGTTTTPGSTTTTGTAPDATGPARSSAGTKAED